MRVKKVDRKLLVATFSEFAPVRELADLLKFTKCEDCIFLETAKGVTRGVMDADPDETYCGIGLDDSTGGCRQGVEMSIMRDN